MSSGPRAAARRLAGRSYVVSKRYAMARMRRREPPVVVFSMGKTGSTAIARAVQEATGNRVFQVFRLEAERLAQAERRYRADRRAPFLGAMHLWESEFLLRRPPSADAPWTVITTIREPIAQAVSAFFHSAGLRGQATPDEGMDDATVETLRDTLVQDGWVREPLRWFEREFAPALGIDVFSEAFDPGIGHLVIETPPVRVLVLRQENLESAPEALAGFLGWARPVTVAARNEGAEKAYGARYRQFLASVRMPESVLDQAYGSRYARHFYADTEIAAFRRRWAIG